MTIATENDREFIVGNYYESKSNGFIRYEGVDENGYDIFIGEDEMEIDTCNLEWHK